MRGNNPGSLSYHNCRYNVHNWNTLYVRFIRGTNLLCAGKTLRVYKMYVLLYW